MIAQPYLMKTFHSAAQLTFRFLTPLLGLVCFANWCFELSLRPFGIRCPQLASYYGALSIATCERWIARSLRST